MDAWVWIVIIAVVVVLAIVAWAMMRSRRTERLQSRYGDEYEHTIEAEGGRRAGESELAAREKRRQELEIRPLAPATRDRFAESWRGVQTQFVDDPSSAVRSADQLVTEVMGARGYPTDDFEQRAADVSVDHPEVVSNYRSARDIADRNSEGSASTEALRQAMVHYRALFEELLDSADDRDREHVR